ncbi:unnamed protein product [Merluccius merluccius]
MEPPGSLCEPPGETDLRASCADIPASRPFIFQSCGHGYQPTLLLPPPPLLLLLLLLLAAAAASPYAAPVSSLQPRLPAATTPRR